VLTNVANQLDVTVNVDPGNQKVSEVDLLMNCGGADTLVGKQTFTSAPPPSPDVEESTAPVTISFNTAAFNPTTGAVAFKNGACTLKAKAITTTGSQSAVSSTSITLNNADFLSVPAMTTTPSTGQNASATDAGGLTWRAGAVNVTVVPVLFSGSTVASATVSLINKGGDNAIGRGQPQAAVNVLGSNGTLATLSGLAPAAGVVTASFPNDTTIATASGVGGAVVDTLGVSVATVFSTGNPGPSLTASTANFIRLDNRAPDITSTPPTFVAGTQNTFGGWVGKNFVFSTDSGSVTLGSAAADNGGTGVDKVSFTTQSAPAPSSTNWTTFATPNNLAETATGSSLRLRLVVCDALNNCANTGQLALFGVDLTAPGYTITAGPNNLQVFNIASTLPTNQTVAIVDSTLTAGATPSGGNGMLISIQSLKPSGSSGSTTACVIPASTSACGTTVSLVPSNFALPAGALTSGEYTMMITPVDQAGNHAVTSTIKYYIDQVAPVAAGGVAVPASITLGTQFTSTATDNMDVAAGNGTLQFPSGVKILQAGSASPTGVVFDNALVRSSSITVTLANFYRSLTTAPGTGGALPNNVNIRAIDAAGNLALGNLVALPPANVGTPSTISNTGSTGITAFVFTADSATVAATHTIMMTSTSTPADAVNGGTPFQQVCFYFASPTGTEGGAAGVGGGATGELIKIGCSSAVQVTQSPRTLVYQLPWTVPAGLASTAFNLFAIGNTSGLDAIISAPVGLTVGPVPTP
jgi:hypothetical protein